MKKGELITNPFEDKRSYKNLKKYTSQDFGFNVDHKRIITREELAKMPLDKYSEQEEKRMGTKKEEFYFFTFHRLLYEKQGFCSFSFFDIA